MATGRSDYPNQINNVLAFPGVFRGALDVRARTINEEMKLAAARRSPPIISDDELDPEYIIPSAFNRAWRLRSRRRSRTRRTRVESPAAVVAPYPSEAWAGE